MPELDYPSQRVRRVPPQPMLLDTCLIQHLWLVMNLLGETWDWAEGTIEYLLSRYPRFGKELVALGDVVALYRLSGPPWAVSDSSLLEFERLEGEKRRELRGWWFEWADYWAGCQDRYPEVRRESLLFSAPEVSDNQLPLSLEPLERPLLPLSPGRVPQFGPFKDPGDRALIRDAFRARIPAILTTDLRTFWRYRRWLFSLGVEVWRPSDVREALVPPLQHDAEDEVT